MSQRLSDDIDLTNHFKSAALSLTHIYKKASQDAKHYHSQGYNECLRDVYAYTQSNSIASSLNEPVLRTSNLIDFLNTRGENLECILEVARDVQVDEVSRVVESMATHKRSWNDERDAEFKKPRPE